MLFTIEIKTLNLPHFLGVETGPNLNGEALKAACQEALGPLPQRLSISHSQGVGVVLGIQDGTSREVLSIGVDIEAVARPQPGERLIQRVFTPTERAWMLKRELNALEAWCVKEALFKAWPENAGKPMTHVEMTLLNRCGGTLSGAGLLGNRTGEAPYEARWGLEQVTLGDALFHLAWAQSFRPKIAFDEGMA